MYGTSAVGNGVGRSFETAVVSNGSEGCDYLGKAPHCLAGVEGFYSPPPSSNGVAGYGRRRADRRGFLVTECTQKPWSGKRLGCRGWANGGVGRFKATFRQLIPISSTCIIMESDCNIDHNANLTCHRQDTGGSELSVRHTTSEGRHVLAYAAESRLANDEDAGTARMSDGVANVQIDPAFAL